MQVFVLCNLDENSTASAVVARRDANKATTADHMIEGEQQIEEVLTLALGKKWEMLASSTAAVIRSIQ